MRPVIFSNKRMLCYVITNYFLGAVLKLWSQQSVTPKLHVSQRSTLQVQVPAKYRYFPSQPLDETASIM